VAEVLLVDDDVDTRRLFRIILEAEGYSCHEAGDGAGALAVLDAVEVDVALVDVRLGDEDGLALARSVVDRERPVAVVMVSGVDDADVTESALAAGAYGYLLKPVRRGELLLHVANARRRHDLEREQRRLVAELEARVRERTADLEQALAAAEAAEAVRSQFVQNVSHELRSPLTVILAGAALLARTEDREAVAAIGDSIEVQGRRLLDLIDRLLEVAALAEPIRPSSMERVDLRGLLSIVADPARSAGRAVEVEVDGSEPSVLGSSRRLGAALGHLVDNALRFTPPDTPLRITASPAPGSWVVRVVDHGPGIDPAFRTRLWEPFVQADGSATRQHSGLGVGLYLCRQLVEWHGGHVAVEDTPGGGCTVVVHLPDAAGSER
jgi:signal transduction histidine kinase